MNATYNHSNKKNAARGLLPLTSDLVFKVAFGRDNPESKKALIGILNIILDRGEDPIVDLTYKNPFSYADYPGGKTMILDIKVVTQSREWIDIEMQVEHLDAFPGRTLVYNAKMLSEQLAAGESYDKIEKSIVVSIVQGSLFPMSKKIKNTFRFKEVETNFELTDLAELHFVELDKIDVEKNPEEMTILERLLAYLRYAGDEEKADFTERIVRQGDEVIVMTDQILKSISEDERLRQLHQARELGELFARMEKRAAVDKASAEGRSEGLAEGLVKGEELGEARAILAMAQKMKAMGKTIDEICELTGLSFEEDRV